MRDGSDDTLKQWIWGQMYVDEILEIAVNDDPTDAGEDTCETGYYPLQNANYNVLALVDDSGDLVERYEYTPYGQRTVYKSAGPDDALCSAPLLESQRVEISSVNQPYGLCDLGHQGLLHDKEFGLIYNRARYLHPRLGRFISRDPLGYVDGGNLYEYIQSSPFGRTDFSGLAVADPYGMDTALLTALANYLHHTQGNLQAALRMMAREGLNLMHMLNRLAADPAVQQLIAETSQHADKVPAVGERVQQVVEDAIQIATNDGGEKAKRLGEKASEHCDKIDKDKFDQICDGLRKAYAMHEAAIKAKELGDLAKWTLRMKKYAPFALKYSALAAALKVQIGEATESIEYLRKLAADTGSDQTDRILEFVRKRTALSDQYMSALRDARQYRGLHLSAVKTFYQVHEELKEIKKLRNAVRERYNELGCKGAL